MHLMVLLVLVLQECRLVFGSKAAASILVLLVLWQCDCGCGSRCCYAAGIAG